MKKPRVFVFAVLVEVRKEISYQIHVVLGATFDELLDDVIASLADLELIKVLHD
jgi:hypothetical protein